MATTPSGIPDPRTAADDDEDSTPEPGRGVSSLDPAEGGDDVAPVQPGSPAG